MGTRPDDPSRPAATAEQRLELALEAGMMGTWEWDLGSGAVRWSAALEKAHGIPVGSFPGTFEAFQRDVHPDDRDRVLATIRAHVEQPRDYRVEYRIVRPDGAIRWLEARGRFLRDRHGRPVRLIGVCADVTDRHGAFEALREQELRRGFLVEASARLASSLDVRTTLATTARLAVPRIVDWCAIDLLDASGAVERLAVEHVDPAMVARARELYRRWPPPPEVDGILAAIRTGQTAHVPVLDDAQLTEGALDPEHLATLRALDLRSYAIVPLRARGRVLGAITFVNGAARRPLDARDVELAEELAAIAAVALDNARLYAEAEAARRAAQAAEARARHLHTLSAALSIACTPEDVAAAVATAGIAIVDAVGGGLWRLTGDGDELVTVSLAGAHEAEIRAAYGRIPVASALPAAVAMRTRAPVYVASRAELAAWPGAVLPSDRHAFAALPLVLGDVTLGVIVFSYDRDRAFDPDERGYLDTVARLCAQALARAQAFEREHAARTAAEQAARAREELMAIVAHDLRNPLGTIVTGAATLDGIAVPDPPGALVRRLTGVIRRSADRMERWISDLLDLARLEGGSLVFERAPVDLVGLARDVVEVAGPVATDKGLALALDAADARVEVDGDRERLAQVLSNLIGNALKFTPAGGAVSVEVRRDGGDAVVSVHDTGPGIPADQRPHIFDRYWRARTRDAASAGLGLSIAKAFVDAHGGRIWVDSAPGADVPRRAAGAGRRHVAGPSLRVIARRRAERRQRDRGARRGGSPCRAARVPAHQAQWMWS